MTQEFNMTNIRLMAFFRALKLSNKKMHFDFCSKLCQGDIEKIHNGRLSCN